MLFYNSNTSNQLVKNLVSTTYFLYITVKNLLDKFIFILS